MDPIVRIDHIPGRGLDIDEVLTSEAVADVLPEGWTCADPGLALSLRVERHGDGILARGRLSGRLDGACSRCAMDLSIPLEAVLVCAFANQDSGNLHFEDGMTFSGGEEPDWYPIDGETIDLGVAVGEQIVLAMPDYPRCREDCKGVCVSCGVNFNDTSCSCEEERVDPRLRKLVEIRAKLKG